MKKNVVAVSIDKVQTFLYYKLSSQAQESQTNNKTLSQVISSSEFVSSKFQEDIQERFSKEENHYLLSCSGKYIFTTGLSQAEVFSLLDDLFQKYYVELQGQLLLKYICIPSAPFQGDQLKAIQQCTSELKQSQCLNSIINRNQELLFTYSKELERADKRSEISLTEYPYFSETINDLSPETELIEVNNNHFRTAVIKADLDGMGLLFKKMKSCQQYVQLSDILNEVISLPTLHRLTKKVNEHVKNNTSKENNFKIFPLYVAGDDIFFIVAIPHLLNGITLCKEILYELNNKIDCLNNQFQTNIPNLSASIGIDISFNREPLRYYYERVNLQLDTAKKEYAPLVENVPFTASHIKICLNHAVFFDILDKEYQSVFWKKQSDKLSYYLFVQTIRKMNTALKVLEDKQKDDLAGNRFFYTLLEKITTPEITEQPLRCSNVVINHLLPQTWSSNDWELQKAEFTLLTILIELLSEPKEKREGRGKKLVFDNKHLEKLRTYLRLFLIFSTPRFQLITLENNVKEKYPKTLQQKGATLLLNRSIDYLYTHSLQVENPQSLGSLFIKKESYKPSSNRIKHRPQVHRKLRIGSSMFYRLKKLEKERTPESYQRSIAMIQSMNTQTKEEIQEIDEKRELLNRAPSNLCFDKVRLEEKMASGEWTNDVIDSLLLFYKLDQLSITFKTKIKKGGKK